MKALCLQGGGAKGAYQAGALKALTERGIRFDCAVGASVGSINAAMYALGKVDALFDLWQSLDFTDLFPEEGKMLSRGGSGLSLLLGAFRIFGEGLDTSRIRALLEKYVDEDALRASPIRFGLVTVKAGEENELCRLFIEDIPKGQVVDYLMASSAIPFFKKVEIDGVRYLDGGIMDNLPIGMLADAGYDDITAIRLGGDIRYDHGNTPLNITYLDPSEKPGHTMGFQRDALQHGLYLGYFDTLRRLDGLMGQRYFWKPFEVKELYRLLMEKADRVRSALALFGEETKDDRRQDVKSLLSHLTEFFGMAKEDERESFIALTEQVAAAFDLPRWKVYELKEIVKDTARIADFEKINAENEESQKLIALARTLFEE